MQTIFKDSKNEDEIDVYGRKCIKHIKRVKTQRFLQKWTVFIRKTWKNLVFSEKNNCFFCVLLILIRKS